MGLWIPLTAELLHLAGVRILDHLLAGDQAGVAQPYLPARGQAEPLLGGVLAEVVLLHIEHPGEGHLAAAPGRILRVKGGLEDLHLVCREVLNDHAQRAQHPHHAGRGGVEFFPDSVLQQGHVHHPVPLGHPDAVTELANGRWRVSPPPETGEGGHAGIVPAADQPLLHQGEQLALAQHGVAEVEPGELELLGLVGQVQGLDQPVIQRAVVLELQGAQGVGDALDGVGLAVGEVVHGVDAPGVPGAVVRRVLDAVQGRVPHVQVGVGHVDLGPQHVLPFGELSPAHALQQVQVLLHRPIPKGAVFAHIVEVAPVLADLFQAQAVHVGQALVNEVLGELVELFKVV